MYTRQNTINYSQNANLLPPKPSEEEKSVVNGHCNHLALKCSVCVKERRDRLPRGSQGVGRNTFLSSPHLCFIIVFICDLFVSRDDPLMS